MNSLFDLSIKKRPLVKKRSVKRKVKVSKPRNRVNNKINFGLVINKQGTDKGSMDYMLKMGSKKNTYNKTKKNKLINSKKTIRPYGEYKKLLDMNWKQTKKRFPLISPYGDADFDGSYNAMDCKPLDPSRDGAFSRFLNVVSGGKVGQSKEDYKKEKLSKQNSKKFKEGLKTLRKLKKEEKYETKLKSQIGKESFKKSSPSFQQSAIEILKKEEQRKKQNEQLKRFGSQLVFGKTKEVRGKGGKTYKIRSGGAIKQTQALTKEFQKKIGVPLKKSDIKKGKKGKNKVPRKTGIVGRPSGEYKTRINPFTGQPIQIPATEFYKLKKKFRDLQRLQANQIASQVDTQELSKFARTGVPYEQAKQIIDTKQLQQVAPEGYHVMQNGEPKLMKDSEMYSGNMNNMQNEEDIQVDSMSEMYQNETETPQESMINSQTSQESINQRMERLRAIKEQKRLQRVAEGVNPQQFPQQFPQRLPIRRIPVQSNQMSPIQQYQQLQQLQQFNQFPQNQVPINVKTDIMTGRQIVKPMVMAEKWIRPKEYRNEQQQNNINQISGIYGGSSGY